MDRYGAIYADDVFGSGRSVQVTVDSQENTDKFARAGIMVANDITDPGGSAGDLTLSVTAGAGPELRWDSDGNGNWLPSKKIRVGEEPSYPITLKLERTERTFTGYYSTDGGETFTELGSTTIPQAADVQDVGMFVNSRSESRSKAEFSGFEFGTVEIPTPVEPDQQAHPLPENSEALDRIVFGSGPSEDNHDFQPEWSKVVLDEDDVRGRALHFPEQGRTDPIASMSFTVACDPAEQTYITVKLRQDPSKRSWRPLAVLDGDDDQVGHTYPNAGWRCLTGMFYNGRFSFRAGEWVYVTMPLPKYMTEGKEAVEIRLATMNYNFPFCCDLGELWPAYRAYTHTVPMFATPSDEAGSEMQRLPEPDTPTPEEQLAEIQDRVEGAVELAQGQDTASPRVAKNLARASGRDWISTVDTDAIFKTVRGTIDAKVIEQAAGTHPRDLFGGNNWKEHGLLARAFDLLSDTFANRGALSETMPDHPEAPITRREAYAAFFEEAYQWRDDQRRGITNQVQIVTQALVSMNDALEILDPDRAPPDSKVDAWIDQAIGIAPLEKIDANEHDYPVGPFHVHTEAGLNKEPNYSFGHGGIPGNELQTLAADTGLDRVLQRMMDYIESMGWFRFRMLDADNDRPTVLQDRWLSGRSPGWPGGVAAGFIGYGVRPASAAMLAARTDTVDNEVAKRWAELMVEHGDPLVYNGYDADRPARLDKMLWLYEGIRAVQDMEASTYELPWERDRAVFGDTDHGMVSITDGDHRLLVSLGHSPSRYISNTVVSHYMGPDTHRAVTSKLRRREFPEDRTAPMPEGPLFAPYKDPEGEHYMPWRDETAVIKQGLAKGEDIALASKINGESWPGTENWPAQKPPFIAGWTYFYREADVGPYRIGVNSTGAENRGFGPGQDFTMEVPGESAIDMETGEEITSDVVTVGPRETKVIKVGEW